MSFFFCYRDTLFLEDFSLDEMVEKFIRCVDKMESAALVSCYNCSDEGMIMCTCHTPPPCWTRHLRQGGMRHAIWFVKNVVPSDNINSHQFSETKLISFQFF